MTTYPIDAYRPGPETEDPAEQIRRRIQARRCVVCGTRQLARKTSFFCREHLGQWMLCPRCEALAPRDGRRSAYCRPCAAARNRAYRAARLEELRRQKRDHYHAETDRYRYREALRRMATRRASVHERIFAALRRRVLLAALVRATPGMSWEERGLRCGVSGRGAALAYATQCAGAALDPDAPHRRPGRR